MGFIFQDSNFRLIWSNLRLEGYWWKGWGVGGGGCQWYYMKGVGPLSERLGLNDWNNEELWVTDDDRVQSASTHPCTYPEVSRFISTPIGFTQKCLQMLQLFNWCHKRHNYQSPSFIWTTYKNHIHLNYASTKHAFTKRRNYCWWQFKRTEHWPYIPNAKKVKPWRYKTKKIHNINRSSSKATVWANVFLQPKSFEL